MESVEKFKKEMQARVDELRPYVEEYGQIEQLLKIMDSVKDKAVSNAGAVVAQFEDAVPAFKQEKPKKQPKRTRVARKRIPHGDNFKTRTGLVKKYLRENGIAELKGVREFNNRKTFTFGALMNAMNETQYAGYTWGRALSKTELVDKLVASNTLELVHIVQGKRVRKYYATGNIN